MATEVYDTARKNFALGLIDWSAVGAGFLAYLVDASYVRTPSDAASSIAPASIVGTGNVVNRSVDNAGWLVSADVVFAALPNNGRTVVAVVVVETVSDTALFYTDDAAGLPFANNGGDYILRLDNPESAFARL